jgi:AcrR family transcriptional regulator
MHMRVNPTPVGSAGAPAQRPAQRRRTRKAIVDATIALLARGQTPSVTDVAAAADVSRRTVYLYFPSFDQLLLDATVGALTQASVDRAIEAEAANDDIHSRVERMVRALHRVSPEIERLGRELIRLTVVAESPQDGAHGPRRGYRRVEWIEAALSPWREQLGAVRWRRLVSALAMIVGWEALIVQRDVCGLSAAEGEALSVWAAHALVAASLDERPARRERRRKRATSGK